MERNEKWSESLWITWEWWVSVSCLPVFVVDVYSLAVQYNYCSCFVLALHSTNTINSIIVHCEAFEPVSIYFGDYSWLMYQMSLQHFDTLWHSYILVKLSNWIEVWSLSIKITVTRWNRQGNNITCKDCTNVNFCLCSSQWFQNEKAHQVSFSSTTLV